MVTKAKKEANKAWDRKNMVNLCCRVRREYADRVRALCAENGESVNSILKAALDDYLRQYGQDGGEEIS